MYLVLVVLAGGAMATAAEIKLQGAQSRGLKMLQLGADKLAERSALVREWLQVMSAAALSAGRRALKASVTAIEGRVGHKMKILKE
jgi:hypothetical protein